MKISQSEILLGNLKNNSDHLSSIYLSLFKLLNKDEFDKLIQYYFDLSEGKDEYFKEYGKTNWFELLHKSIRQSDFFNGFYKQEKIAILTDDEIKQYRYLNSIIYKKGYNKYSTEDNRMFSDEYKLYLSEKKRHQTSETSISGSLDSILWNLIYIDKEILYNNFLNTFKELKTEEVYEN